MAEIDVSGIKTAAQLAQVIDGGFVKTALRAIANGCKVDMKTLECAVQCDEKELTDAILSKVNGVIPAKILVLALKYSSDKQLANVLLARDCKTSAQAMDAAVDGKRVDVVELLLLRDCKMNSKVKTKLQTIKSENSSNQGENLSQANEARMNVYALCDIEYTRQ